MGRGYLPLFIIGSLLVVLAFARLQPEAVGDDRKFSYSTEASFASVESLEDVEKLLATLKVELANLRKLWLGIEQEASEKHPNLPELTQRLEKLQEEYFYHNEDATIQEQKCARILEEGNAKHSDWNNCQSWGAKINRRKKDLDTRKDAIARELFAEKYQEWRDVRGEMAFIGVEIELVERIPAYVKSNCDSQAPQCFQCLWSGTDCSDTLPEALHHRKYRQQLNDLFKNKSRVIAEELDREN